MGGCDNNGTTVPPPAFAYDSLDMVLDPQHTHLRLICNAIFVDRLFGDFRSKFLPTQGEFDQVSLNA